MGKDEAFLYAVKLCREYRDACIEFDHFFKLYNWYLNQRNLIDEALEKRHTNVIIDLDLALRVMSGTRKGCVCDLRKILDTGDVKCRKTGPARSILEKEMKRIRESYKKARDKKCSLHFEFSSFFYLKLCNNHCSCETV